MTRAKRGAVQNRPSGHDTTCAPARPAWTAGAAVPGMQASWQRWGLAAAVVLIVGTAVVGFIMLAKKQTDAVAAEPPETKKPADGFAADRPAAVKPAPFDGKRAMGYLEELCKIGPRMSGTDGMKKQQEMLEKHFTALGGKVAYQRFNTGKQRRLRQQDVEMANLIVSWHPDRKRRVILCSHYDTRPIADQEPDRTRWRQPFVSANDGGSGVALLMELAHHVKNLDTTVGIDFVFFDGEEYIWEQGDDYFFGSKHFGAEYRRNPGQTEYTAAILLDMVGGKNLRLPIDQKSFFAAEKLVREVYGIASELRCDAFKGNQLGPEVEDDHVWLNANGIKAIDLIDFSYPHWHRLSDVPANCSGDSLEQVARVLSVWLQRTK